MTVPAAVRRAAPPVLAVIGGAVVSLVALGFVSPTEGEVGPGRAELRIGLGRSTTQLHLPPLGTVSADTHRPPVAVDLRVDEIDVSSAQALITSGTPRASLRSDVEDDLQPLAARLARRVSIAALLLGGAAGALVPRRRWHSPLLGAAGGLVAVGTVLGLAWRDFDAGAFEVAPRFAGPLEQAPRIVETVLRHVEDFGQVEGRFAVLSNEVADLYSAATTDRAAGAGGETTILHVSDVHLNPVGLELAQQLAERFRVDAIIDTGDLTSFGQPFEAGVGALLAEMPVPYYFVPGNHDSLANRQALAAVPTVSLLDGTTARVGDVEVLGVADPVFTAHNDVSKGEARDTLAAAAPDVARRARATRADLLAVHDPAQAASAWGDVAYVVAGHVHERRRVERQGTLLLTVGSTGATGLGTFTVEAENRYEAQLLRFRGDELVAVDYVTLTGERGEFEISRALL